MQATQYAEVVLVLVDRDEARVSLGFHLHDQILAHKSCGAGYDDFCVCVGHDLESLRSIKPQAAVHPERANCLQAHRAGRMSIPTNPYLWLPRGTPENEKCKKPG